VLPSESLAKALDGLRCATSPAWSAALLVYLRIRRCSASALASDRRQPWVAALGALVAVILTAPTLAQIPPGHPWPQPRNLLVPSLRTHARLRLIASECACSGSRAHAIDDSGDDTAVRTRARHDTRVFARNAAEGSVGRVARAEQIPAVERRMRGRNLRRAYEPPGWRGHHAKRGQRTRAQRSTLPSDRSRRHHSAAHAPTKISLAAPRRHARSR